MNLQNEQQLKERVRNIVGEQKDADTKHLNIMLEVGRLVLDVMEFRKYKELKSAEADVGRMLKGAGARLCGGDYIEACRLYLTKFSDKDRRDCVKYQVSVEDVKIIVKSANPDNMLSDIRNGRIEHQWGRNGRTYALKTIKYPRKSANKQIRNNFDSSNNPSCISATKIINDGEVDTDRVSDILVRLITVCGASLFDKCLSDAKQRIQKVA